MAIVAFNFDTFLPTRKVWSKTLQLRDGEALMKQMLKQTFLHFATDPRRLWLEQVEAVATLDHHCSNPLDDIYALVSMFDLDTPFPVDYSLTVAEVFTAFTAFWIQGTGTLRALHAKTRYKTACNGKQEHWTGDWDRVGLPSWVLDYAALDGCPRQPVFDLPHHHNATKRALASGLKIKNTTLRLQGKVIASVQNRSYGTAQSLGADNGIYWKRTHTRKEKSFKDLLRMMKLSGYTIRQFRIVNLHSFFFGLVEALEPDRSLSLLTEVICSTNLECPACFQSEVDSNRTHHEHSLQITCPLNEGFTKDVQDGCLDVERSSNEYFRTDDGRLGWGPDGLEVSHHIFVLYGTDCPVLV